MVKLRSLIRLFCVGDQFGCKHVIHNRELNDIPPISDIVDLHLEDDIFEHFLQGPYFKISSPLSSLLWMATMFPYLLMDKQGLEKHIPWSVFCALSKIEIFVLFIFHVNPAVYIKNAEHGYQC